MNGFHHLIQVFKAYSGQRSNCNLKYFFYFTKPFFLIPDSTIERPLIGSIIVSSYNCYLLKKRILSNSIRYLELKFKPTRLCALKSILFITHSEANKISLYSKDFEFIKSIDKIGNSCLNNPNGITSSNQNVYICDTGNNRILLCNLKLELLEEFGGSVLADYGLNRPTDVCFNNNFLYISDNLGSKIFKFTVDLIFIESFDINKCPLHIKVLYGYFCVYDLETHSSSFYDQTLYPSTTKASRESSFDEDFEVEQSSPLCVSYENEGPFCTIDNSFVQWNKRLKCFHFYDHEGKLDSNISLKSLEKVEKSIQQDEEKKQSRSSVRSLKKPSEVTARKESDLFPPPRLYKHEMKYLKKIKSKSVAKNAVAKTVANNFEKITETNFKRGNSRGRLEEESANLEFLDDICFFNEKLLFTYDEKRMVII